MIVPYLRSVGGTARPAFPVQVMDHTLVAPFCLLMGCRKSIDLHLTERTVPRGDKLGHRQVLYKIEFLVATGVFGHSIIIRHRILNRQRGWVRATTGLHRELRLMFPPTLPHLQML